MARFTNNKQGRHRRKSSLQAAVLTRKRPIDDLLDSEEESDGDTPDDIIETGLLFSWLGLGTLFDIIPQLTTSSSSISTGDSTQSNKENLLPITKPTSLPGVETILPGGAISVSSSISERSKYSITYSEGLLRRNLTLFIKSHLYQKIKFMPKGWGGKICRKAVQAKVDGVILPHGSSISDFEELFAGKVAPIFTTLRKASEMNASKCVIGRCSVACGCYWKLLGYFGLSLTYFHSSFLKVYAYAIETDRT